MTARGRKHKAGRRFGELELASFVSSSIDELRAVNALYDQGNVLTARTLAAILCRLIEHELIELGVREDLLLASHLGPIDEFRDQPHVRGLFVDVRIYGEKDTPVFKPVSAKMVFRPQLVPTHPIFRLPFSEWYQDPVLIEGAWGRSWVDNGKSRIPFEKRTKLSRRKLLRLTRDKLGAHLFSELDVKVADYWDWFDIIPIELQHIDGSSFSFWKNRDSFSVFATPVCAFVRTISEEVVHSSVSWKLPDKDKSFFVDPMTDEN
jgi:hypothetical protein